MIEKILSRLDAHRLDTSGSDRLLKQGTIQKILLDVKVIDVAKLTDSETDKEDIVIIFKPKTTLDMTGYILLEHISTENNSEIYNPLMLGQISYFNHNSISNPLQDGYNKNTKINLLSELLDVAMSHPEISKFGPMGGTNQ